MLKLINSFIVTRLISSLLLKIRRKRMYDFKLSITFKKGVRGEHLFYFINFRK